MNPLALSLSLTHAYPKNKNKTFLSTTRKEVKIKQHKHSKLN